MGWDMFLYVFIPPEKETVSEFSKTVLGNPLHVAIKLLRFLENLMGFPSDTVVKNPLAHGGDVRDLASISRSGRSPGRGHGNTLQYSPLEIPWAEDPGGLQSMGSVGHDWACTHTWEPYTLVIKSLLESESLILNSPLPFCPLESYWASISLSLNLVSKSCSCGMIEWDNAFKVLHKVLVTQYGVAAEAAAIVAILLIIFLLLHF